MVPRGLRTVAGVVLVVAGRAGGLFRELPKAGLVVAEVPVVVGRVLVESLDATGLVRGLVGGWAVGLVFSSVAPLREEVVLSMVGITQAKKYQSGRRSEKFAN